MTDHLVGVNGVIRIDPNEVLGIERDEGVVTGASVLLWPGRWRIALRAGSGGGGGGSGGPVAWADVTDKPTSFASSAHRHDASEIDNMPSGSGGPVAWADVTDKPAVIAAGADAAAARTTIDAAPSDHTHAINAVTGLAAVLDGLQPAGNYATTAALAAVASSIPSVTGLASTGYVDAAVAAIEPGIPEGATLDALPDSATRQAVTPAERAKITAAASGAGITFWPPWEEGDTPPTPTTPGVHIGFVVLP